MPIYIEKFISNHHHKNQRVFMLEIADMADKEKEWGFEDVLENEEVKS